LKISEYTLLEDAFEASFGFMLNRIAEAYDLDVDFHAPKFGPIKELAADRCFSEFIAALEELGVELGDVEAPLRCK
jgi:hypothetical protein